MLLPYIVKLCHSSPHKLCTLFIDMIKFFPQFSRQISFHKKKIHTAPPPQKKIKIIRVYKLLLKLSLSIQDKQPLQCILKHYQGQSKKSPETET